VDYIHLVQNRGSGVSCEHSSESSGSIKGAEFLD
jgi:hypothetical protein